MFLVKLCLATGLLTVLSTVRDGCHAIISGNGTSNADQTQQSESAGSNGTTFFYEPNAFLMGETEEDNKSKNETPRVEPAPISMTKGRSGRMLDLDALVGDVAASKANKMNTGNRQSRYLSGGIPSLGNLGNGKRLHIQGFIPIIGVKDDSEDDDNGQGNSMRQKSPRTNLNQPASDLPYAQSSMGHASYGVHRYLNSEDSILASGAAQHQQGQSNSVVETIKRPIKKLTASLTSEPVKADCVCVPFYMCKNGVINESSLGKSQLQQLRLQMQQQPMVNQKPADLVEMKAVAQMSTLEPAANVLIDERSNEREIITMPSVDLFDDSLNDSSISTPFKEADNSSPSSPVNVSQVLPSPSEGLNMTNIDANNADYSQEILGRMLGLKSPLSRVTLGQSQVLAQTSAQAGGSCGLLRTCCSTAQDNSLARFQQQQQQAVAQQQQQQQQNFALQRYQSAVQSSYSPPKTLYGQPASNPPLTSSGHLDSMASSLVHRSSQFPQFNKYPVQQQQQSQQLAQFTRSAPNGPQNMQLFQQMYQQPKSMISPVGQVSPAMLETSLQQQSQLLRQSNSPVMQPSTQNMIGTRKILEGRCGLRQAAGISGRVQNLQYHESSADFGEYPAQAAILKRLPGTDSLFVCGATLISQYWVATAAHCVRKYSKNDLKVRLGEWDVHRDDEFYPFVEREARDLVIHPEFVSGNLVNDIALIRLDSPVDPSLPHVNPACLPTIDESFTRQRCWVTGWGKDSFGQKGTFQAVLGEVELPVVGHNECEMALRQTRLGPHYRLHSGFICAGGEGGKDACEGDGGSGLYCAQDGVIKVAGLVSWGIGCGQAGVPGVYVNMAHYRTWIENIISIDEDIYSPYSNMLTGGGNSLISERNAVSNSSNSLGGSDNRTASMTATTVVAGE